MTADDLPDVLTVEEAARFLRISRGLGFAAARRGDLPAVRLGRRLLVPRARLLAWLHERKDVNESARH